MDASNMTPNRRDLLQMAGMLGALPLQAADNDKLPPLIGAIVDEKQARIRQHPFGEHRLYFQGTTAHGRTASAGSVWVKPGMEPHPPHQSIFQSTNDPETRIRFQYRMILKRVHPDRVVSFL
jgi:hypothetical protein